MRLARALEEKQLDTRLRDKLLAEGKLTKETLDSYVSGLEDDAGNAQLDKDSEENQNLNTFKYLKGFLWKPFLFSHKVSVYFLRPCESQKVNGYLLEVFVEAVNEAFCLS